MVLSKEKIPAMLGLSWWDVYDYPIRISDQNFGCGLLELELHPISTTEGERVGRKTQAVINASGYSCVLNTATEFSILLQAQGFRTGEINVQVVNNWVVVHGKHESREDKHGFVEREFTRRYMLPGGINPQDLSHTMNVHSSIVHIEVAKKEALKEMARSLAYEVPITTPSTAQEEGVN